MAATFTYAACYQAAAVCRTPLRTADSNGDTESVLRDQSGRAFLQGTSISGALRDWLTDMDPEKMESLFGSADHTGHLIVSDGVFSNTAEQSIRPRLHIDGATGSASQHEKFDIAHLNAGSNFMFTLTWMGTTAETAELETIEQMLSAVNAGLIRFGAQKANGFGQVSLQVKKQTYDLMQEQDREKWLSDTADGREVKLLEFADNQNVTIVMTGHADSLLVKASAPIYLEDEKRSYTENLTEDGHAVLPGSSIKGAVRSRVSAISDYLGLRAGLVDSFFGHGAEGDDDGRQGLIRFEDAQLNGEKRRISRIRINRFTGGVIRSGLFTEEPQSSGITLKVSVPADLPIACGLLIYALRDLGMGLYNLGSGGAIGRGYIQVQKISVHAPNGKHAALNFEKSGTCDVKDDANLVHDWLLAVEEARHEN